MTKEELYDQALLSIGSKPLDGANGLNTERGRACEIVFPGVVREVQSLIPWAELVTTTLIEPTGFEDAIRGAQYNKPPQCLRVLALDGMRRGDGFEEELDFLWTRRGGKANMPCRYVRLSLVPDEWSAELTALVRKLFAARIVAPIMKDLSTGNQLEQQFWEVDRARQTALHLNRVRNRRTWTDEDNYF